MTAHSVSVRKDKGMAKVYARGNKLHIDYIVDGERKRKATGLDDTKENRKLVEKITIPKLNHMIATGEIHKKKPKNFGYYFEIFLKRKAGNSSYNLKKYQWDNANALFGNKDIDKISRLDIKNFLMELPIKNKSKGAYRTLFVEVFEMAIDDRVIDINPAINIRMANDVKKDIEYFTKEEANLLLRNAKGILYPYLLLALNTGMRPEEILGLQIGDIDNGRINIKRVRTRGMIRNPKTKSSIRKIPCPQFVIDEVVKIQGDNIFLFGSYDEVSKLYKRWKALLKDVGFEHRKLYSCRHTFATIMLQDSIVSINELSGLLGHSSVQTTLSHYASVIDARKIDLGINFDLFGTFSSQSQKKTKETSQNRA